MKNKKLKDLPKTFKVGDIKYEIILRLNSDDPKLDNVYGYTSENSYTVVLDKKAPYYKMRETLILEIIKAINDMVDRETISLIQMFQLENINTSEIKESFLSSLLLSTVIDDIKLLKFLGRLENARI